MEVDSIHRRNSWDTEVEKNLLTHTQPCDILEFSHKDLHALRIETSGL